MEATYMGLAVPLFPDSLSDGIHIQPQGSAGAFDILTITQSSGHTGDFVVLEDGDASTELLVVEEDGVTNWTVASPGADNVLSIVITDTSTVTSGYLQGVYVSVTPSSDASYTTGGAQINAFATDIFLDGTIGCEVEGMYVYIATNGTAPTLTSGNLNGVNVYIDDLKAAASSVNGIQLHMADGNSHTQSAFVYMRMEGSSAAIDSMFQKAGTAALAPTYFLRTNNGAVTGKMIQTFTVGGTQDLVLVCNINGSTYWIPLYAASA